MATNTKRILPVGIQDFPKIRENGYIYADKTPQIYRLISDVKGAFFLNSKSFLDGRLRLP